METKKIPNHESIGEYSLFVRDFDEKSSSELNKILDANSNITKVFIESDNQFQNMRTNTQINGVLPSEFSKQMGKVKIPNWVSNSSNLEKILDGHYQSISPVTVEFVPTLNCNYRCTQCAYAEPKKELGVWNKNDVKDSRLHMSESVMRVALDGLAKGGVENILFTGGGEPLMNPLTIDAMEHAKDNGSIVALYTNGRLLTDSNIERILATNPLFIRISVYGGNQETVANYTNTTDSKSFQKVIANVAAMAKQKKLADSDMNLSLSYLVHPTTAVSIEEFVKAILSMEDVNQLNYIRFTPSVDYNHGKQHDQAYMEQVFRNIEEKVKPLFEDIPVKIKLYYHRLDDLNQEKSYSQCRGSGWFGEVGPNGELYLCCEKLFMPEYVIGDLRTQSLEEVWSSQRRESVLARVNEENCNVCPTLCKPHELNKIFDSVELMRHQGKIYEVRQWSEDLLQNGRDCGYCAGKLDNFQS
ncbi:MAG: radical SAM protein [Nanoarchaeota archaeon]|nr:radical SAM protein [Nanoarchaeota archaeon]